MKKLITYIFPIYNEELNIDKLYTEINKVFKEVEKKYDLEVICINDGSRDNSWGKLMEICNKDNRFKIVNFSRNFGHQIAVTAGLDLSKGDAVIIMDADLQDPPKVSLELIRKWEEGYEVVYAQRRKRKDTLFKRLTAFVFYRVLDKFADINIPKDTGDFRLIDRKVVESLNKFKEKNRFLRGMISYIGFKQTPVLFDRDERYAGKTGYPLKKMIKFALDGITSFSTTPLKLITQFGLFISLISIIVLLLILVIRLFSNNISIDNNLSIIASIYFIGGCQMVMIGVLGTYIGRIYSEVQNRPLYLISEIVSNDKSSKKLNKD